MRLICVFLFCLCFVFTSPRHAQAYSDSGYISDLLGILDGLENEMKDLYKSAGDFGLGKIRSELLSNVPSVNPIPNAIGLIVPGAAAGAITANSPAMLGNTENSTQHYLGMYDWDLKTGTPITVSNLPYPAQAQVLDLNMQQYKPAPYIPDNEITPWWVVDLTKIFN